MGTSTSSSCCCGEGWSWSVCNARAWLSAHSLKLSRDMMVEFVLFVHYGAEAWWCHFKLSTGSSQGVSLALSASEGLVGVFRQRCARHHHDDQEVALHTAAVCSCA
jgi:hypothetical protein